jgi:hypothetical protein
MDRPDEILHPVEDGVDVGRAVLVAMAEPVPPVRPQGDMQNGPVFSAVDVFAGEHPVPQRLDASLPGEGRQQLEGLALDALTGEVDPEPARAAYIPLRPAPVPCEKVSQVTTGHVLVMNPERLPGGQGLGSHGPF